MTNDEPIYRLNRSFDAPFDLLWRAWTDASLLAQWFGPKGVTTKVKTYDLRPGGVLHSSMTAPDGNVMWARFDYVEVDEPRRLAWVHGFSDEAGNRQPAPFPGPFPLEMLTTVTFSAQGAKSAIELTWQPIRPSDEERAAFVASMEGFDMGWGGSFEALDELVAKLA